MSRVKKRITIALVVVCVAGVASFALMRGKKVDDGALRASLVGSWRATDAGNSALHRNKGGVASEDVEFSPNGSLVYRVVPKVGKGEIQVDTYSWDIVKGKLQLRYTGAGSTMDKLPRIRVSVDGDRMSMQMRGYSDKVFERVASQGGDGSPLKQSGVSPTTQKDRTDSR
jgi:hypothetical protein